MFAVVKEFLTQPPEIEQEELSTHCIMPYAFCEISQRVMNIKCSMDLILELSIVEEYEEAHEFSFSIEFISLDGSYEDFVTQDRNIVRSYVGDDVAAGVMPLVLKGLDALVTSRAPPIIYRVTKSQFPPAKALTKHELVTSRLQDLGYRILVCDCDPLGRTYWIMARTF